MKGVWIPFCLLFGSKITSLVAISIGVGQGARERTRNLIYIAHSVELAVFVGSMVY
jgi:hypothetical protein